MTVSYSEPFNVARQFASLDHISGGRAGWNVVTSWLSDTAANFSRVAHPAHDVRYRIAAEYLDVVQGLWDSWEADALVGDKKAGVFANRDKLHRLDHEGEFFQVRGPLNIKRTPQGQPVIFQAGASDAGRDFAAARAEAIFCFAEKLEDAQAYYADVKARAKAFGRDPEKLFIMPGIVPLMGETEAETERNYQELASFESLDTGFGLLSRIFDDHDFRQYDLDGPFPDVARIGLNSFQDHTIKLLEQVEAENLTLRQVVQRMATPRGAFVGTPKDVADKLQAWFEQRGADGFIVFESMPGQLELFVDKVVPILQARGLFRKEYEGETFRENLGLPEPANRYTAARTPSTADAG
jgi:FMN-dependent oxidoreductase (nitrilotriacetate monooxygenase family)